MKFHLGDLGVVRKRSLSAFSSLLRKMTMDTRVGNIGSAERCVARIKSLIGEPSLAPLSLREKEIAVRAGIISFRLYPIDELGRLCREEPNNLKDWLQKDNKLVLVAGSYWAKGRYGIEYLWVKETGREGGLTTKTPDDLSIDLGNLKQLLRNIPEDPAEASCRLATALGEVEISWDKQVEKADAARRSALILLGNSPQKRPEESWLTPELDAKEQSMLKHYPISLDSSYTFSEASKLAGTSEKDLRWWAKCRNLIQRTGKADVIGGRDLVYRINEKAWTSLRKAGTAPTTSFSIPKRYETNSVRNERDRKKAKENAARQLELRRAAAIAKWLTTDDGQWEDAIPSVGFGLHQLSTVEEIAKIMHWSPHIIRAWMDSGNIREVVIGEDVWISRAAGERLIATRDKYWLTFNAKECCGLSQLSSEERKIASERNINPKWRYPIKHAGRMTKCRINELKEWLAKTFGYKTFEGGVWGRHIIAFIYLATLEE